MKPLMTLLVGALLFGSAVGQADDGRGPTPPTPPTAPTPPTPPRPPRPPRPPHVSGSGGFNINIHDGRVQIDGLETMVDAQIDAALQGIAHDDNIPPQVRAKVTARLEKVRAKVKKRLAKIDTTDPQRLGEELGQLGEEIGQEMEQFGEEMDKFGADMDKWGKQFEKNWGKNFKYQFHTNDNDDRDDDHDDDRDDENDDEADHDIDMPAVRDLGDLKLKAPQRDALRKLRAESEAKVANAKRELERAEAQLQKALENVNASDADIARAIDAVAQQEATIRKARILTWVNARRMLDDSQRQKVEGAARKGKTR